MEFFRKESFQLPFLAGKVALAEAGSVQMEFIYLSRLTGDSKYEQTVRLRIVFFNSKAMRAFNKILEMKSQIEGLWPMYLLPGKVNQPSAGA